MTQFSPTEIRLRPDGSIDTAYYMQRGREMRSRAAHDMLGGSKGSAARPSSRFAAFVRTVFGPRLRPAK